MNKTLKKLLIVLGVFIVIAVIFFVTRNIDFSSRTKTGSVLVSETTGESPLQNGQAETGVNSELVALLQGLGAIRLDDEILRNPAFLNLRDISIVLTRPSPVGRANPFAPLGSYQSQIIPVGGGFSIGLPTGDSGPAQTPTNTEPDYFDPQDS
ncbi:MAG: hypothetical protein OEX08_02525 [Candidatus Nomurabacteria bacterium]|nr:hypothetical protein [Candidatus Nomurabacteria bacterium]